ncbi:hypothetical protein T10_13666 [Trichinella papuae]|uniref:Uncharacterized protein n=1 Tax=Trichinella papuae TaxID=268474 RepID=A0A0V1M189_9BILA|nr:hypothetical protein T10_11807 [Trichinella papuae]KRZ65343.1 hypothetical protein T10_9954 [Trichinella papuae]KRZ65444.1 hypothetical protein T10_13666 [Trichinella papuae]
MAVALDAEAMQYLISRIAQLILTVSFNELMLRRDLCNLRSAGIIKNANAIENAELLNFLQLHPAEIAIQSFYEMVVQKNQYLLIKNVMFNLQSCGRVMLLISDFRKGNVFSI